MKFDTDGIVSLNELKKVFETVRINCQEKIKFEIKHITLKVKIRYIFIFISSFNNSNNKKAM